MPNRVPVSTAANSYLRLLDACIASKSLKKGKTVHQRLLKINGQDFGSLAASSVPDKLARLYISCNSPQLAHRVFDSIPAHQKKSKTILWDQLIRAYAWAGPFERALDLYGQMVGSGVEPTKYTYPFVLKACAAMQDFETGARIHEDTKRYGLETDVYVCTALVDFYVKCGCMVEAKNVFDKMPERDVVAWNALINGFSSHGMYSDAISLVCKMQKFGVDPNSSTLVAILPVLGEKGRSSEGKSVHSFCLRRAIDIDVVVGTGLLDMYGKCGLLIYAKCVFSSLEYRNEITWSAVIGACVDCCSVNEAFGLFTKMKANESRVVPSPVVLSALLRGCAKLNDLGTGRYLHCCFVKSGFARDLMTSNTILSMYTKCGSTDDALKFFESIFFPLLSPHIFSPHKQHPSPIFLAGKPRSYLSHSCRLCKFSAIAAREIHPTSSPLTISTGDTEDHSRATDDSSAIAAREDHLRHVQPVTTPKLPPRTTSHNPTRPHQLPLHRRRTSSGPTPP
ncbi:Pentatricopeptide repeat-containing protein [Striga hermonthica]|uniref:Pentatricopeptide repeat-containing protein n=1 Tax=Striga hermonthica TaxID=68872 RepID=A0A9N7N470_STRHE|nr:Pentatricopeptide repeat-containing protein [Striga hermonthica]